MIELHIDRFSNSEELEQLKTRIIHNYAHSIGIENFSILKGPEGKPFINDGLFHFSISHSASLLAIAFSKTEELGLDIEMMKKDRSFDELVNFYFDDADKHTFFASNNKIEFFYDIWTEKESLVKIHGSTVFNLDRLSKLNNKYNLKKWTIFDAENTYSMCLRTFNSQKLICKVADDLLIHDHIHSFYMGNDEKKALLSYEIHEGVWHFTHTFVPEIYRGQGIAAKLVQKALEYCKNHDIKIIPQCSFVEKYLGLHTEFPHLLSQ